MKTLSLITLLFMVGLGNSQTKPAVRTKLWSSSKLIDGDVCMVLQGECIKKLLPEPSPKPEPTKKPLKVIGAGDFGATNYTISGVTDDPQTKWESKPDPPQGDCIPFDSPACKKEYAEFEKRVNAAKPEPMDVPAVKKDIIHRFDKDGMCNTGEFLVNHKDGIWCEKQDATCTDKRRVLLTDEGGGKHCILFPKESK